MHIAHEVTNIVTALALVEAGLGVSLLPASIREFSSKNVVLREVLLRSFLTGCQESTRQNSSRGYPE